MSANECPNVYRPRSFAEYISSSVLGVSATIVSLAGLEARASSEARAGTELRNKTTVEAGFKAWAAGTGSPYDLLSDDARWTIEGYSLVSKTYSSREAFLREVIRPFNARMKVPLKPAIRNVYTDGDTVIVFFDARGIARDGQPYVNTYAWFLDIRDDRIVRASAFFDSVAFNEFWIRVAPSE
ncbi:nuclear transport factor 2 family protein [Rhizobiaceae bacterium n13]|uniref:Nuclear transport factor 2 family protein n=1 Tax=Ferirhizobium litorale TaxID=2927786 RepID=A0AAE3QGT2_9HYPH|nr:nuclear transport factor 2 family protein [Fererhizobium litorale]MDI7864498.1 nuclear transport factor 2 family protein [Fererhizobium litorale]MDI7924751.1 nuclear transport factor 2 family protein [Fererhizobium litorale]